MKIKTVLFISGIFLVGLINFGNRYVSADEMNTSTPTENTVLPSNDETNGLITYIDEQGNYVVRKYETDTTNSKTPERPTRQKRAAAPINMGSPIIARWGSWEYTNIAISTGVLSGAINHALYSGISVALGMFGIPTWALAGMLNLASWTKKGSKPGEDIAKLWDKNKNGWVGFYVRKGYDGAGRVVATEYSTR